MKYDDLLSVPYKEGGRDKNGMDCYGYVLELTRRNGNPLKDINPPEQIPKEQLMDAVEKTNLKEITPKEIHYGDIMQCIYEGNLHIGFILDKKLVTHMTRQGPRETPMIAFIEKTYWRIEND